MERNKITKMVEEENRVGVEKILCIYIGEYEEQNKRRNKKYYDDRYNGDIQK